MGRGIGGGVDPHTEGAGRQVDTRDLARQERGTESGGLVAETLHEIGAHDPVDESRVVLDVGGQHQLAALPVHVHGDLLQANDAPTRLVGREVLRVAAYSDDVFVLGENPKTGSSGLGVMMDGSVVAKVGKPLVRDALGEAVEVEQVYVAQVHGVYSLSVAGRASLVKRVLFLPPGVPHVETGHTLSPPHRIGAGRPRRSP